MKRFFSRTRWYVLALAGLSVILLSGIAYGVAAFRHVEQTKINLNNVILNEEDLTNIRDHTMENQLKLQSSGEEPSDFYALVIGLDYRDSADGLNTDTLLVAHVIPEDSVVKLLSIPRDLRISNLRGQPVKVNSLFSSGYHYATRQARDNPELLTGGRVRLGSRNVPEEYISSGMVLARESLERYLHIDIDYTFLATFETVTSLVDAVGGVEIEVQRSMQYDMPSENTYIRFEPGRQVMNGEQALQYARFRQDNRGEAFHSNDFERGLRQQQLVTAFAKKLASRDNLPKLLQLLDIVSSNVKTDMQPATMVSLATEWYGTFDVNGIYSLPFPGRWKNPYVEADPEHLEALIEQFSSLQPPDLDRLAPYVP